jgi:two-component system, cell cycle sensor histidine kinase and response regulator CckA
MISQAAFIQLLAAVSHPGNRPANSSLEDAMTPHASSASRRILIIDDNRDIHADFRKILTAPPAEELQMDEATAALFGQTTRLVERPEFELASAYQGQQGLAVVQEANAAGRPFALAFVDMRMPPGWDGIETTARLLEADPNLQFVICTAYSDYSWVEIARRLGAPDRLVILKKPFDIVEIQQLCNAMTEKWCLGLQARKSMAGLEEMVRQRTEELEAANQKLVQDLAQRREIEHALRESEQRLAQIVDFLPDATFAIDRAGKIIAWNRAIEELTGRKADTMLGKSDYEHSVPFYGIRRPVLIDLVLQSDDATARRYRLFKTEGDVLVAETELAMRGKKHTLWIKARPLYNGQGEVVGAIETLRDVTDRKELEMQLRQSQKMEAFGQLAAGVAHDFNNILTVIHGNAFMLQGSDVDEAARESGAAEICAASLRATNLTRQLLTFSQRQVFQPRPLDFNELVTNMTKMLRRLIGEHINLEAHYAPGTVVVDADPVMMEQILINLAVNSRDAMPQGGNLLVQTAIVTFTPADIAADSHRRPGDFIRLTVTDTGVGIDPEHLPHIFEPFYTTKGPGKGTGLGLATVFGIVKQHHGWIEIESQPKAGATFHVFLPQSERPLPGTEARRKATPIPGGSETILLVEDEPALRQFFRRLLEGKGYRIHEAESGVAALLLVRDHPDIDLLLTDMVMPGGINGRELAERLRAKTPLLKVIFSSGYTDDMLGRDSVLRENENFLEKPFDPDKLLRRVRDYLDTPA